MRTLYRVRLGRDDYMGTAEEVVTFMSCAVGAPGRDADSYMREVARSLGERMGVSVDPRTPEAFLDSLGEGGIARVERLEAPSEERTPPGEVLGEGPIVYGKGVDPRELSPGGE
jgi:hypothetical protein